MVARGSLGSAAEGGTDNSPGTLRISLYNNTLLSSGLALSSFLCRAEICVDDPLRPPKKRISTR